MNSLVKYESKHIKEGWKKKDYEKEEKGKAHDLSL